MGHKEQQAALDSSGAFLCTNGRFCGVVVFYLLPVSNTTAVVQATNICIGGFSSSAEQLWSGSQTAISNTKTNRYPATGILPDFFYHLFI
jgi:hypothetical protein